MIRLIITETVEKLLQSDESAYSISKATGVDASTIQRVRSGDRKLANLTLETAEKLYMYALEKQKKLD